MQLNEYYPRETVHSCFVQSGAGVHVGVPSLSPLGAKAGSFQNISLPLSRAVSLLPSHLITGHLRGTTNLQFHLHFSSTACIRTELRTRKIADPAERVAPLDHVAALLGEQSPMSEQPAVVATSTSLAASSVASMPAFTPESGMNTTDRSGTDELEVMKI